MASPTPGEPLPPVPFAFTAPSQPPPSSPAEADRAVSYSAVCPYSCTDEMVVGAFKGAFAGTLWGAYSLHRNLQHVRPTAITFAPITAAFVRNTASSAKAANAPVAALTASARLQVS